MIVEVKGFSKLIWGTFLLLAAAFIISNQVGGFVEISFWSILVAALAMAYLVQCVLRLYFAPLPIPLAVLYITFQTTLGLPYINMWMLLLASVLASLGLHTLLPKRKKKKRFVTVRSDGQSQPRSEMGGDDNNPNINVQFGSISRYLNSECLETVQLECNFGALEVYFDQVQLSPNGAEAYCECSFGSITLFVPKEWQVFEEIERTFAGVELGKRRETPGQDAPKLTIKGDLNFSGVEVKYI